MYNEPSLLDNIKNKSHTIRGLQVMFDNDLANLYEIETKQLNRTVKRNTRKSKIFCVQEIFNFFAH